MRCWFLALTIVLVAAVLAVDTPAAAAPPVSPVPVAYRSPADAPVTTPFAPPPAPWAAGNRGIDYATEPGDPVWAAADGEVVFAGLVGGSHHVVVLHADGLRTSYSFLDRALVRRGDHVTAGQPVGVAAGPLHFGARAGEAYVDPALLFGGGPPQVHLVPEELRGPQSEAQERSGLQRVLRSLSARAWRAGTGAVAWARRGAGAVGGWARGQAAVRLDELRGWLDHLQGWAHYARAASPPAFLHTLSLTLADWRRSRSACTPAGEAPPPAEGRRIAVLVGGLGSSSGDAAVLGVDTAALGYAPGDVVQFSYVGGRADQQSYGPADTQRDLRVAGARLAGLLVDLRLRHPGVTVDVIAHSQGGLVARTALVHHYDRLDPRYPPLGAVVTLGTPHQGADLATALAMVRGTHGGGIVAGVVGRVDPAGIDPRSVSVEQLSEVSRFVRDLNRRPLPDGVRLTSIAARGDVVVPAGRSRVDGAANVVVSVDGLAGDHERLPAAPAAQREIALALAGRPPTCQSLPDALLDATVSHQLGLAEDALGMALTFGGHRARVRGG